MKYTKEVLKNKKIKFEITLNAEEWEHEVAHAYGHEKAKYSVQGFRKGKAPRAVIEKINGEGVFYEHALEHAFYNQYDEILKLEKDIEPISNPSLDIKSMDKTGAILIVEVEVKPEVKLGKYVGLEIAKEVITIKAAEVKAELMLAQDKAARQVEIDGPVKDGDTVNIYFSGSVDGVKFDGGTADKFDLVIGSGSFIPGFEEQIIGMKKGETKDVTVKFPADYHAEELKGKESVFEVKVHTITAKEMPELNDEFASDASEFETLKDWKADIKKILKKEADKKAKIELENKLIDKISDNATVEVPESMVEEQIDSFLKEFEYRLQYQGLKLEDYAKATNTTMEDIRNGRREDAIRTVKTRLTLEAIIKAEKLDASEEEFNKKMEAEATKEGKTIEEFQKTLTEEKVNYLVNDLMINKLLAFLRKENKL